MLNFHLIWRQTFSNTLGSDVWGLYQNVFVCFKLGKVFKSVHHLKIMHTVTRPLRGLVKCALFSSNAHFFILYLSHTFLLILLSWHFFHGFCTCHMCKQKKTWSNKVHGWTLKEKNIKGLNTCKSKKRSFNGNYIVQ